jgi:diguanylate cyclase (GGDEF)-like protein
MRSMAGSRGELDPRLLASLVHAQGEIAAQLNLSQLAAAAARRAMELTGASGAAVELADGETVVIRGAAGVEAVRLGARVRQSGSLSGLSMMTGKMYVCHGSDPGLDALAAAGPEARATVVVPLQDWGIIVGALRVVSLDRGTFEPGQVEVLQILGRFVGAAVARAVAFEAAAHGSMHDALTGLPNRALLKDRLDHELSSAQRTRQAIGIVFLDLNGFKQVNDTLGHQAGDVLLVEVARRLGKLLRGSDTLARLGGDEFVVLLPQLADAGSMDLVVRRIRAAIARPFVIGGHRVSVGASIGTCYADDPRAEAAELLARADRAMYDQKRLHQARRRAGSGPQARPVRSRAAV